MKNSQKIIWWTVFAVCILWFAALLLLIFMVPTRIVVSEINRNANFGYPLLSTVSEGQFDGYVKEEGYGVTAYGITRPDAENSETYDIIYHVSRWPMLSASDRITTVELYNAKNSVFGLSPGCDFEAFEETLLREGFSKSKDNGHSAKFDKWGVQIRCSIDSKTERVTSITVAAQASNVLALFFG